MRKHIRIGPIDRPRSEGSFVVIDLTLNVGTGAAIALPDQHMLIRRSRLQSAGWRFRCLGLKLVPLTAIAVTSRGILDAQRVKTNRRGAAMAPA